MRESVSAAYIKSLCQGLRQAEKGTLSPLECLSFANFIQADLPTCATICRSLPFFYAYSTYPRYLVSCVYTYLPYIMLEAMTYMDEEKVLLPKNAMSH